MRTTIDLDEELLAAVRENAAKRRITLSAAVGDALKAYLEAAQSPRSAPFELITAGTPGGRYPSPRQIADLLTAEEIDPYAGT